MQLAQFQVHAATEEKHWWFLSRRAMLREVLGALYPPSKSVKIVDVGCGTGGNTAFVSQFYDCMGVDPSPDAIGFAKQRFPSLRFVQGKAPDDVMDVCRAADVLLLMDVLEHVEQDVAFVHSLIAAMKPGAHLLMMAPADKSLWSPHDAGFEHFRRYEDDTFRALWAGQAVTERLVSRCNTYLYPVVKSLRVLSAKTGKTWGPGETDLGVPPAPINWVLKNIFSAEASVLRRMLEGKTTPFKKGVSVFGIIQKNG